MEGAGAVTAITVTTRRALEAIRPEDSTDETKIFKLSADQISNRVAAAALAAGLGRGYSGHSGRVGLARTMTTNGAPTTVTMDQGRWSSPQMVAHYTRGEDAGAALRYL